MTSIRYEWDATKAASNLAKHGVSFDEAATVFWDEHGLLIPDPDHSREEERSILLGFSSEARLLLVVHVFDSKERLIRIISAWRASRKEQLGYEERRRAS